MEQEKYQWKKRVNSALLQLDETPLLPRFSFDFAKLQEKLTSYFAEKKFSLKMQKAIWRTQDKIKEGFSDDMLVQALVMTPVEGNLFWMMDKKDISKLVSHMLIEPPIEDLSSEPLQEGFYRYLCLLAIDHIQSMGEMSSFSLKFAENGSLEETGYLCLDVEIKLNKSSIWGRLAISPTFRSSFSQKLKDHPSLYENEWKMSVDLPLKIEGGKTYMSFDQLKEIHKGDFVLFDRAGYDPKTQKGIVTIVLGNTPLLHAKIKSEKIKILDYAFYYEDKTMAKEEEEAKEEEKIFEEEPIKDIEEETPPIEKGISTEEKTSAIKDTEICLTAEIGKFSMTIENLIKLQPGNFLELSVSPEDSINLTVNGKIIGKGEIVHLGEALGVRILEINN